MPFCPDDHAIEAAADLFGMLATPTRLRIVCELIDGERNVSDLLECVAVSQPNMSQHLGMLYRAGVLGRRRIGSQVFYRVERQQVRDLCRSLVGQPERGTASAEPGRGRSAGKRTVSEEQP